MWELSAQRDDTFPTVFRNLGIAWFNKKKNKTKALHYFEKAFTLDPTDARVLMELDQLYKRLHKDEATRLVLLENHLSLVNWRDDVYLERAAIYNFMGEYEKAFELIMQRKFHPWEGGEGKVSGQYVYSLTGMARQHILDKDYEAAIEKLKAAQEYPDALGEGKLYGAQENDLFYWLGMAYDGELSKQYLVKATQGLSEPSAAMFYNDQPPDKILYQGLAWAALGEQEKANTIFQQLVRYGETHLNDELKIDYFAVSLPDLLIFEDDLTVRNTLHCRYMMGLGWLGLQEYDKAAAAFTQVLEQDMHFGAQTHLLMVR